jgi:hypothetical protein
MEPEFLGLKPTLSRIVVCDCSHRNARCSSARCIGAKCDGHASACALRTVNSARPCVPCRVCELCASHIGEPEDEINCDSVLPKCQGHLDRQQKQPRRFTDAERDALRYYKVHFWTNGHGKVMRDMLREAESASAPESVPIRCYGWVGGPTAHTHADGSRWEGDWCVEFAFAPESEKP